MHTAKTESEEKKKRKRSEHFFNSKKILKHVLLTRIVFLKYTFWVRCFSCCIRRFISSFQYNLPLGLELLIYF